MTILISDKINFKLALIKNNKRDTTFYFKRIQN